MFNTVIIKGQSFKLDPKLAIGKGGEADIYDLKGRALKVFKGPDHPDYQYSQSEQQGARERLNVHQKKLPAFPQGLPPRVVSPIDLAYDQTGGKIIGYTMPLISGAEVLLRYADKTFRQAGIDNESMLAIFRDLLLSVEGIHQKGAVIGDFNDLNILVKGSEAYIVDADSFQFGNFLCRVFTAKFIDPTLCDPRTGAMLIRPHNKDSDWYAFAVMLMQTMLFVDPYGGVYIPKNKADKIPQPQRPLKRVTVFHPQVRYPKPALPLNVLPDDLLDFFQQTFVKDLRGEFPAKLLEMRWTKCSNCGQEHARNRCPYCATPGRIAQVQVIKGTVSATEVFKTPGLIVYATLQDGQLAYLYHENGHYYREDGSVILTGLLSSQIRFRIQGKSTLLGSNGRMVVLSGSTTENLSVDSVGLLPIFDANRANYFWLEQGRLFKNGDLAPTYLGDALAGQTRIWVGPSFGFGFYRAGALSVSFVFDARSPGINDNVPISLSGQLIDSTCVFTDQRCWFLVATQQGGKTIHQCFCIKSDGTVEASAQARWGMARGWETQSGANVP